MEVRRTDIRNKYLLRCLLTLLMLWSWAVYAQVPVKSYTVKNGKMYIALGKDIGKASLDSFINQHELYDLDLTACISTGSTDTLKKLGWKIEINNTEVFVISKPLFSADNVNTIADKMVLTQKGREPIPQAQVHFGYNRFRNKPDFTVADSAVTFFLRGNTRAGTVLLAGNFTNWQNGALPMSKTDSGWVASVKLGAGKHLYKFIIDGGWTTDRDNSNLENDGMGNDNSVYYKPNQVFRLEGYTSAKRVYLAGSFNQWKEKNLLMRRTETGWMLPVYLSEGTHTYRFIADGNWLADPANPDKLPNEYNEFNSVVRIGRPYLFKLAGYTEASKVVLLGSFNDWRDNELLMTKTTTGWELPYTLGGGNYEYRIKVDGKNIGDSLSKNNFVLVIDPNFTFRLKGYANAARVYLAGDINNWNGTSLPMKRAGDEWIFNAHINPGKHLYKFVVDGKWILDPANKLWEQNQYGTGNSILWFEEKE